MRRLDLLIGRIRMRWRHGRMRRKDVAVVVVVVVVVRRHPHGLLPQVAGSRPDGFVEFAVQGSKIGADDVLGLGAGFIHREIRSSRGGHGSRNGG